MLFFVQIESEVWGLGRCVVSVTMNKTHKKTFKGYMCVLIKIYRCSCFMDNKIDQKKVNPYIQPLEQY